MENFNNLEMTDFWEWYEWRAIRNLYLVIFTTELKAVCEVVISEKIKMLFGDEN
jgi:hypothetical protein